MNKLKGVLVSRRTREEDLPPRNTLEVIIAPRVPLKEVLQQALAGRGFFHRGALPELPASIAEQLWRDPLCDTIRVAHIPRDQAHRLGRSDSSLVLIVHMDIPHGLPWNADAVTTGVAALLDKLRAIPDAECYTDPILEVRGPSVLGHYELGLNVWREADEHTT